MVTIAIGLVLFACILAVFFMIKTIVICVKNRERIPVGFVATMGMVFFFEGALLLCLCEANTLEVVATFVGGVLCTIIAIIGYIREAKTTRY